MNCSCSKVPGPSTNREISRAKLRTGVEIVSALKKCRDLERGRILHREALAAGFHHNKYIAAALINMYSKCSSVSLAQMVFDSMIHRDVVAWTSLILGYVEGGNSARALELFHAMDCEPDSFTFVAVIKALACLGQDPRRRDHSLEMGIDIHRRIRSKRLEHNVVVLNSLIAMYGKCGSVKLAREVFDEISQRDAVSWNTLILGYAENGESLRALEVFDRMDCDRSSVTFVAAITACKNLSCEDEHRREIWLKRGILIHEKAKTLGFEGDIVVASALIDMYGKCGAMFRARKVFDEMRHRNVVTWNGLIWGYVETGEFAVALDLFEKYMNCAASYVTFAAALQACGLLAKTKSETFRNFYLEKGLRIHGQIVEKNLDSNIVVANSLINMYSKCGSIENAKKVFDKMVNRDVVAWNSIISGFVENGKNLEAIELFFSMDCKPTSGTFVSVLKACANLKAEDESNKRFCLERGALIHKQAIENHLDSNVAVSTTLIDMYSKVGSMENAKKIFQTMTNPDVVTWTSLISGYVENGESLQALDVFATMDCEPDKFTYVAVLKACESLATLAFGLNIHSKICKSGVEQDQVVAAALTDFYMKCGSMDRAEEMFNNLNCPDLIFWNTLIAGYSSNGNYLKVCSIAKEMKGGGVEMNCVTFTCILMACSHMGLVQEGRMWFDCMVKQCGLESLDVTHYNCMVDLLCRANMLEEAVALVQEMPPSRGADVVIWRTLLNACKNWKNIKLAAVAFDALVTAGSKDSADYILMSDIYACKL